MNFQNELIKYKKMIDSEITLFFDSKLNTIKDDSLKKNYSIMRDFVLNGGKRLRPISMIMAYNAVSGKDEKPIILLSLSVEFLHNSTLVHDDIMDEDELRRNKPTTFKNHKDFFSKNHKDKNYDGILFNELSSKYSASNAILDGNILLSMAYGLLMDSDMDNSGQALKVLNNTYNEVVDGQILDIVTEYKEDISENQYLSMISKKTSVLFKASIEIGALLGNASGKQIEYLSAYAENAALAFQIKDDIMDISTDMDKGHELGSDIKQGKKNLLIIKAMELADDKQKKVILETLGKETASTEDINSVIEIIKSTGALKYSEGLAKEKIDIAKENLEKAELNELGNEFFSGLADYMVDRKV